ncbi:RrF2 family transcriptional regulator [Hydrogenothermus marinus]|uniref:BadM/Rrf2 family transcriptional regulator n=1 Tax=Hydrogenothermus marinus TaxID=133270 RepID=A0A3M0BFG7_9AQUI|nr:Rrf2 family transcriptional regulator [Hydrogenothermus marinus]RMA93345.1 BadM/Rrf2 family transcriptional regulator [Hydrogenothermus marinus]
MLSTACKDAIRAIIYIAKENKKENRFISIREISENLGLSFYFLSKILQILVKDGFLESYRGPNGGVKLKKDLKKISLFDIIKSIDGTELFESCILGFKECSDSKPCAIHNMWKEERDRLYNMFKNTTLENIEENLEKETNIKI